MFEYKSGIIRIRPTIADQKSKKHESELADFDEAINKWASEGWELVCYSWSGFSGMTNTYILATFKRKKS